MHTTNADPLRQKATRLSAPAMALLLLSMLAVPADAQSGRGHGGRGGSGHQGKSYGGHSGDHGARSGHGAHRYGGQGGYGGYGYHYRGYSGSNGRHGYRGNVHQGRSGGYGGHGYSSYRGGHGYRGYAGYGGRYGGRGYDRRYRYPSYYGGYDSYLYYRGTYGFGYYGYPGISVYYDSTPRYVARGDSYAAPGPGYQGYVPSIAAPEAAVTETGEPYVAPSPPSGGAATGEPYDARPQPARVKLAIEPGDASVYLDGRFLGLASELPAELWIDPGTHRLEVARPGFTARQVDLELDAGEQLEVDSRLEAETRVPDLHR